MYKDYEHGREYATYEELAKAARRTPSVPIVLDTDHDHRQPLRRGDSVVGVAYLKPCPHRRGLQAEWHFHKEHLPAWLEERIRRRENIPVSTFQFVQARDGQQRDILFDHVAVLKEGTPRCPPERCGIGVADAMTEEKPMVTYTGKTIFDLPRPDAMAPDEEVEMSGTGPETKPGLIVTKPDKPVEKPAPKPKASRSIRVKETPVSSPVSSEVEGKLKGAEPKEEPAESSEPTPEEAEVAELREKLKAAQAQVSAVRAPLMEALEARGMTPEELQFVKTETLQKMVKLARQADTQSLPGTTPPRRKEPPKTETQRIHEEEARAKAEGIKRQKERWPGVASMFDNPD